jgi:hypothetical protein
MLGLLTCMAVIFNLKNINKKYIISQANASTPKVEPPV